MANANPQEHAREIEARLAVLIDDMRSGIKDLDAPQLEATIETAAEVLGGLKKAFSDYREKDEAAWRG